VTLAVTADPTVSGQQSFIIDRGEQVHTLEAAKALLAAQVAAFPSQSEEAFDEDEPFDVEVESEVETEETEGVTDDLPVSEETGSEAEADGHKRKRRRRRRGRPGEAREGGPARDNNDAARVPFDTVAIPGVVAEESESDEDESDEQPGAVRTDQAAGGERGPAVADVVADAAGAAGWRRSGRIDCRRTQAGASSGSGQRSGRFRRKCSRATCAGDSAPIHRTNARTTTGGSWSAGRGSFVSRGGDRSGSRKSRPAAFDGAREGELPVDAQRDRRHPSVLASLSHRRHPPQPPSPLPRRQPIPSPAARDGGRGASATANKGSDL